MTRSHLLLGVATLLAAGTLVQSIAITDRALNYVNRYGGPVLQEAFLKDREAFVTANTTFQPANATCISNIQANIQPCIDCAVAACKAKIENDCTPPPPGFWEGLGLAIEEKVLDPIGEFFVDDVGSFFEEDVGGVFNDVGDFFADDVANNLETAFGATGDWFENDFADFWKNDFAGGVVAVGEEIGDFFSGDFVDFFADDFAGGIEDAAGDVADFFEHDFTNAFEDAANEIGGAFEDAFNDVGDFFGGIGKIFGKRRRRSVDQSGPEPTCDQLNSKELATENCPYYAQVSYCSACSRDPETVCPGYQAAYDEYVRTGVLYYRWKTVNYKVNSVTYDYDPSTGGFNNYKASVDIFGENYQVEIPDTIEIHDSRSVGAVVALKALTAANAAE